MAKRPSSLDRRALLLVVIIAATILFASTGVSQTTSPTSGGPPAGWMEKWVGRYAGQDRLGKIVPPGYKVLLVHELPAELKRGPHEPDEIEVVESLLQPWALARTDATDYEVEDPGILCRPTGLFMSAQGGTFELLASPEKLTMVIMTNGGIHTGGIRRIYMNRPHLRNPPLTYRGDAVGHWEGDTLVIDVVGFNTRTWLTRDRARHSEALHVVERWRMINAGNDQWLEKIITVDDRFALTGPYTLTRYQKKLPPTTPSPEILCQDTPESRRAWIKLYKRAVREHEEHRRSLGPGQTKPESR